MRLILAFLALLLIAQPARADDVAAAGRGVVRIVTIAVVDDEVVGFGRGSGFAIAPNRIVTNAHVVELAERYPGNVVIGVVPSEGDRSFQGRLVAIDAQRDLAIIEFSGAALPPLAIYGGQAGDGMPLVSLGYPGNVDLATARSSADFITPATPVRSEGILSGRRLLQSTQVLVHTASIARGNSGGPLLDRCGRVMGVNSGFARGDEGDASFAFAISAGELAEFLRESGQAATIVSGPCTSIEAQIAADAEAEQAARAAAEAAAAGDAARTAAARDAAIQAARADNQRLRENLMGAATLLLVLGAMAVGWGMLLRERADPRWRFVVGGGAVGMAGAVLLFVLRPGFDPASIAVAAAPARAPADSGTGRMACRIVPERSRVTTSSTGDVAIDWRGDGCMNGRTQYAEDGKGGWERILVPDGDATVSVLAYRPATRTYTTTRYLLPNAAMEAARRLRRGVTLKACSTDQAARGNLAGQQAAIRAALPALPNERLVYRCTPLR